MITKCCNCGAKLNTALALKYVDLQGAYERELVMKWGICPSCGLIVTQNPFSEQQLTDRYENNSKFEYDSDYVYDDQIASGYVRESIRKKTFIDSYIGGKYQSVLEVGAASGYNISLYKNDGKRVVAIEPSPLNCKIAKDKYGIEMYCGMFGDFVKQGNKPQCDLVYLSNVLEHIVNPREFIETLNSFGNQYFFIEVPQLDFKFVNEPFGMMCEEHVNIFTFESLQNLMASVGFDFIVGDIHFDSDDHIPAGYPVLTTLWERSNSIKIRHTVNESKKILKDYIETSEDVLRKIKNKIEDIPNEMRLAVWGTGHHASLLLGETILSEKNIVRVYDSDLRKTKYTFAGIPITPFNDQDIKEGVVQGILIATYTAQTAIEKIVDQYRGDCQIYLLY